MKKHRFIYLMAVALPLAAMAGRVYACRQTDTARVANTKTLQAEDDNEKTQPNAYQLFGHGDPVLDSLGKKISYYSNILRNYERSQDYEALKTRAQGFSKPEPTFYNNDTLRHIMAGLDQIKQYFKTHTSASLPLKRDSLGQIVGDYFKTQKFIAINTRLQQKYHIDPAKSYSDGDAGYRKYREELFKKMPGGIKDDLQQLKTLSEQQRAEMQSPEFLACIKKLPVLIDSMKGYYKTPHVAQYSYAAYEAKMDVPAAERRKAEDELTAYHRKPEYMHALEMLNEYSEKMRDYYKNTPVVKIREETWKNELKTILADDYTTIVHPSQGLALQ
ncbi:MAG: hypothetical protein JST19_06185 [Bacteroidetes bacterium]|nr:hypothetical protein [Bacteroidota bacterium]